MSSFLLTIGRAISRLRLPEPLPLTQNQQTYKSNASLADKREREPFYWGGIPGLWS